MDFLIELVGAILEVYVDFFTNSMTDKEMSKGRRVFLKALSVVICLGILTCLVVGIILLVGGSGDVELIVGIVLVVLASVGILAHIIMVLVNSKKNKNISQPLSKEDIEYKDNNNSLLK